MKIHHPTNGVAAIDNGAGTKYYFSFLKRLGIDTNDVLQISASVNGIIHSNAIDHHQHPVSSEAAYHRTSTTELAFLYKHSACLRHHVGTCLRIVSNDCFLIDVYDLLGNFIFVLLPLTYRKYQFVKIQCMTDTVCNCFFFL